MPIDRPIPSLPLPPAPSPLSAGFDEAIAWLRQVVAGERIWVTVDKAGEESVRNATGDETMAACDKLLKYGAAIKEPPVLPLDEIGPMLDRISARDLATMQEIVARASRATDPG